MGRIPQLVQHAPAPVGIRPRGSAWSPLSLPGLVAWYQPKGAASLAASYVNRANPGTNDAAPGVAPTFATATGWTFNGATQYLTTGVKPFTGTWSALCQYDLSAAGTVFGLFDSGVNFVNFLVQPSTVATYAGQGGAALNAPALLTGNYGIASFTPYRNGSAEPNTVPPPGGQAFYGIYIGALNADGAPGQFSTGNVSSFVVCSGILSAADMATAAAWMAAQ